MLQNIARIVALAIALGSFVHYIIIQATYDRVGYYTYEISHDVFWVRIGTDSIGGVPITQVSEKVYRRMQFHERSVVASLVASATVWIVLIWLSWKRPERLRWRFSLRVLLIASALMALLLGGVIYAIK